MFPFELFLTNKVFHFIYGTQESIDFEDSTRMMSSKQMTLISIQWDGGKSCNAK